MGHRAISMPRLRAKAIIAVYQTYLPPTGRNNVYLEIPSEFWRRIKRAFPKVFLIYRRKAFDQFQHLFNNKITRLEVEGIFLNLIQNIYEKFIGNLINNRLIHSVKVRNKK